VISKHDQIQKCHSKIILPKAMEEEEVQTIKGSYLGHNYEVLTTRKRSEEQEVPPGVKEIREVIRKQQVRPGSLSLWSTSLPISPK
jgi:hypothetical protein